jgi:hypothetical protein
MIRKSASRDPEYRLSGTNQINAEMSRRVLPGQLLMLAASSYLSCPSSNRYDNPDDGSCRPDRSPY